MTMHQPPRRPPHDTPEQPPEDMPEEYPEEEIPAFDEPASREEEPDERPELD
jgi:hypothetical protein